ncbi:hypothetical protein TNCV_449101 [Trichonephila clavipes]|nr:hypothetical protein TNCV_449101 [Trichonephila clavipes]
MYQNEHMCMTYNLINPARPTAIFRLKELMIGNGGRLRPKHGRRYSNLNIDRNSQFFGEHNEKKHFTVEIIRTIILLMLSRERDMAPL